MAASLTKGTEDVTVKLIIIGNSGVGKSSFMNRYVNHRFTNLYRATIGTDFLSKTETIDGVSVTLQVTHPLLSDCCTNTMEVCFNTPTNYLPVVDLGYSGHREVPVLGTPLYRGAHCCMLMFDVTSQISFSALEQWRKEFLIQGEPKNPDCFPFIVLGNKIDLPDREVSSKRAQQWCEQFGAEYFEGSAKDDNNVEKTFLRAAYVALQQYKKHTLENTGHFQITCKQPRETGNNCQC